MFSKLDVGRKTVASQSLSYVRLNLKIFCKTVPGLYGLYRRL